MTDGSGSKPRQSFAGVFIELHGRAKLGFQHPPFIMAFWFGLVLAGGLGVWVEIYGLIFNPNSVSSSGLRTSIATFFPAVIGATSLQMAFEDELKSNRGVAVCAAFILCLVFMMMTDEHLPNYVAFPIGLLATFVSLWIWCAANGNSPAFQELPADAAIGDLPLDAPLSGAADLEGLKY